MLSVPLLAKNGHLGIDVAVVQFVSVLATDHTTVNNRRSTVRCDGHHMFSYAQPCDLSCLSYKSLHSATKGFSQPQALQENLCASRSAASISA